MKYGKAILIAIGVVALLVSLTSQAGAEIIEDFPGLALKINDHGQGPPEWVSPPGLGNPNGNGNFNFHHEHRGNIDIDIDVEYNPDPFVFAYLSCVNMTDADKTFDESLICR